MTDQIAVNQRRALSILIECGVINDLNVNEIYARLCAEVKQPATGYFYVTDVHNFAERIKNEQIKAASGC